MARRRREAETLEVDPVRVRVGVKYRDCTDEGGAYLRRLADEYGYGDVEAMVREALPTEGG